MRAEIEQGFLTPLTVTSDGRVRFSLRVTLPVVISVLLTFVFFQLERLPEVKVVEVRTIMNGVFLMQSGRISCRTESRGSTGTTTCMSAVAGIGLSLVTRPLVSRGMLDSFIREGHRVHCLSMHPDQWMDPLHLPRSIDVMHQDVLVNVSLSGSGPLHHLCASDIEATLTGTCRGLRQVNDLVFIFSCQSKSMVLVPIGWKRFLVFNPNCTDSNNDVSLRSNGGACRLFRCLSLEATVECILRSYPARNGSLWSLHVLQLTLEKRVVMESAVLEQ